MRLNARQWGLVAIISAGPLLLGLGLGAACPELLQAVLGTPLGGLCWGVAVLLGMAGGALYASALGRLAQVPGLHASAPRRSVATVLAALPSMGLCVVPALFLLIAGPAFASALERQQQPLQAASASVRSAAQGFVGQVWRHLPRSLPVRPGALPW